MNSNDSNQEIQSNKTELKIKKCIETAQRNNEKINKKTQIELIDGVVK